MACLSRGVGWIAMIASTALRVSPAVAQAVAAPAPPPVAAPPASAPLPSSSVAAAPQEPIEPAEPPPRRAFPFARASPLPRKPPEPREPRSVGAMFGASIGRGASLGRGAGTTLILDGRIGAAVHPKVAVFAEAMGLGTSGAGGWFLGGGVRLANAWVFLDARAGGNGWNNGCDFDDPCTSVTALGGAIGAGVELVHGKHAGLEIRVDVLRLFHDTLVDVGVGGSFYVF